MNKKEYQKIKKLIQKAIQEIEDDVLKENGDITSAEFDKLARLGKRAIIEAMGFSLAEYEAFESDTKKKQKEELKGEKGEKGDTIKGDKGDRGGKGDTGIPGKNGREGKEGKPGKDGKTKIIFRGKQGEKGDKGDPADPKTLEEVQKEIKVSKDFMAGFDGHVSGKVTDLVSPELNRIARSFQSQIYTVGKNLADFESAENLWDRSGTTLEPHTANDNINIGTGTGTFGTITDGTLTITGGNLSTSGTLGAGAITGTSLIFDTNDYIDYDNNIFKFYINNVLKFQIAGTWFAFADSNLVAIGDIECDKIESGYIRSTSAGNVANVAIGIANRDDTGLFKSGSASLGFSAYGTEVAHSSSSSWTFDVPVIISDISGNVTGTGTIKSEVIQGTGAWGLQLNRTGLSGDGNMLGIAGDGGDFNFWIQPDEGIANEDKMRLLGSAAGYMSLAGRGSGSWIDHLKILSNTGATDGSVYMPKVYNTGFGGGKAVYVSSTGLMGYDTSSIEHKKDVQDLTNSEFIYQLRPVEFKWKLDGSGGVGLIAEEVDELNANDFIAGLVSYKPIYKETLVYDGDDYNGEPQYKMEKEHIEDDLNTPETVNYSQLITPMLAEIQKLKAENEMIKAELCKKDNSYSWCKLW